MRMFFSSAGCVRRSQGQKPQVKLALSEAIMCLQEKGEEEIPKEHSLIVSTIHSQTLAVLCQTTGMKLWNCRLTDCVLVVWCLWVLCMPGSSSLSWLTIRNSKGCSRRKGGPKVGLQTHWYVVFLLRAYSVSVTPYYSWYSQCQIYETEERHMDQGISAHSYSQTVGPSCADLQTRLRPQTQCAWR